MEDAVRVLRHVHRLCRPGGIVLDLTTVRPEAAVERDGVVLGRLDQASFLERAARSEEAVDRFVADGLLVEEASVELDVLKHFDSGPDLLDDVSERGLTSVPPALGAALERVATPLVERSYCLLRRLRLTTR
jgi:SAM-dependent methyltransferase